MQARQRTISAMLSRFLHMAFAKPSMIRLASANYFASECRGIRNLGCPRSRQLRLQVDAAAPADHIRSDTRAAPPRFSNISINRQLIYTLTGYKGKVADETFRQRLARAIFRIRKTGFLRVRTSGCDAILAT